MAVEALKQRYLIMPDPFSLDVGTLPVKQLAPLSLEPEPPFENNCGHDVESLLWLALFMLFFKMDIMKLLRLLRNVYLEMIKVNPSS